MGNLVTNRIRIEITGTPDEEINRIAPLLGLTPVADVARDIVGKGWAEAALDPLIALPMPEPLKALPDELGDKIDLALAASTKFDFVYARGRLADPMVDQLPHWMRPKNRRQVIEENRQATKSNEELRAWADENLPEAMRVAHLMKLAYRDTGHMEPGTWFRDAMGSRSFAATVAIEISGDAVLVGFDTINAAPVGWFAALAKALPDVAFSTFSWDEDTDYSVIGVADGDGAFDSIESDDPDDVRQAKAGARGILGRKDLDRDFDDDDDEPEM